MKYLIYEMFSGVGFCNQLFSLETAVYMSNISNRKLILLIKNPLCHCGNSSWDYGNFLDFFSDDYLSYLPQGIKIVYGRNTDNELLNILNNSTKTKHIKYKDKFSNVVFIDKELDTHFEEKKINDYLRGRNKEYLYFHDYDNFEYLYINQSNASRILYNFYTNLHNTILINNITRAFTKLNTDITSLFNTIDLPNKFIAIHLRFGDKKHDVSIINNRTNEYLSNINFTLLKSINLPIIVMCDRKDSNLLDHFKFNNINIIFTDDIINTDIINTNITNNISLFKQNDIVKFLLEKYICEQSEIFIANQGSTVSSYINYVRYINNKNYCNIYSNTADKLCIDNNTSFINNRGNGRLLSWQCFWTDNVIRNPYKYKIITLTNNGYKTLTENLLISMKKIGILHSIKIYCLDSECYDYFKNKYTFNEVVLVSDVDPKFSKWIEYRAPQNKDVEGKKMWAEITKYKIIVINIELVSGNDVVFIDGDIVINEPFIKELYNNIQENDLLIQNDNSEKGGRDCMCTGFFLMKTNPKTISCTNIENINMDEFLNDQQYLRWASMKYNLKFSYLNLDKYPNGKYYRTYKPTPIPTIIHFNYDSGPAKIKRMSDFNYYYMINDFINMTFSDWLNYKINITDIIINSSVMDGSDRLTNLPIGVQHEFLAYFKSQAGNVNSFCNNDNVNTMLCLSSFSRNTDRDRRQLHSINRSSIANTISQASFITKQRYDTTTYFQTIGKFKFVVSPEGNGIDTHRHWETLYSKGIPIIEDNVEMRKKLEGLPVLWTKDYSELTEEYLNQKYQEILKTNYDFSYLLLSFYCEKYRDELYQRSKYWCFKKNHGESFNHYYKTMLFNTPITPCIINNIIPSDNRILFFGLKDGNGIPLDKKLYDLFKKENGVFIDVGAHDGVMQNNTLYLEKHQKWNGIVISPNKDKYFECIKNRPNSICCQFACVEPSYTDSIIHGDFWRLSGSRNGLRNKSARTELTPCSTLTNILDTNLIEFNGKYKKNLTDSIDLIKIDTSSHEYEVLLGLDLNKYRPKYILIEILKDDYDKIVEYLNTNNYHIYSNFSYYTKENHRRWDGTHNDYLFVNRNENITLTIQELNSPIPATADIPIPPPPSSPHAVVPPAVAPE